MKRKHLTFQFKLAPQTKDASEECVIQGYANTSDKDRVGDVVFPSAFEKSLPTYMSNPVLLANHDWNDPCGVVTHAEIQDKGLYIEAKISATRPDIKTLIREGVLRTFSIGYNELDADFDEPTQTKFIKALELLEISIVTVPANAAALFREVGANQPKDAAKETDAPKPQAEAPKAAPKGETKVCDESKSTLTAESFKALTGFIADVQDALGEEKLDATEVDACIAHFTKCEEVMTKAELLAILRKKSAPVPTPAKTDGNKDSAAPPAEAPAADAAGAQPSSDMGKMIEACLARLDAISEAVAKLMEDAGDDAAAPEAKPGDEGKDGAADPKADPKKDPKADPKKDEEMSDEDAQKALDDVDAQIRALEDEGND